MIRDPKIPQSMRLDLGRKALGAQQSCLDLFDAIEAGDLPLASAHIQAALTALLDINTALKPLAIQVLLGVTPTDPEGNA